MMYCKKKEKQKKAKNSMDCVMKETITFSSAQFRNKLYPSTINY